MSSCEDDEKRGAFCLEKEMSEEESEKSREPSKLRSEEGEDARRRRTTPRSISFTVCRRSMSDDDGTSE